MFYGTKNKKIQQRIWIFFIWKKSVLQILETIIGYCYKNRLYALKTDFKKVAHKAAEATGEFIANKIADKFVKLKLVPDVNSRNVEEIVIPPEKSEEILIELRKLLKMEHYKISRILNDLTVSKFVTKNGSE